jgi:hypothetical protein
MTLMMIEGNQCIVAGVLPPEQLSFFSNFFSSLSETINENRIASFTLQSGVV